MAVSNHMFKYIHKNRIVWNRTHTVCTVSYRIVKYSTPKMKFRSTVQYTNSVVQSLNCNILYRPRGVHLQYLWAGMFGSQKAPPGTWIMNILALPF